MRRVPVNRGISGDGRSKRIVEWKRRKRRVLERHVHHEMASAGRLQRGEHHERRRCADTASTIAARHGAGPGRMAGRSCIMPMTARCHLGGGRGMRVHAASQPPGPRHGATQGVQHQRQEQCEIKGPWLLHGRKPAREPRGFQGMRPGVVTRAATDRSPRVARNRSALPMTETDDRLMASAAISGESNQPKAG